MAFWLANESRKTPNVGDDMHTGNLPLFPADFDCRQKKDQHQIPQVGMKVKKIRLTNHFLRRKCSSAATPKIMPQHIS
jgi:hypothetical protein